MNQTFKNDQLPLTHMIEVLKEKKSITQELKLINKIDAMRKKDTDLINDYEKKNEKFNNEQKKLVNLNVELSKYKTLNPLKKILSRSKKLYKMRFIK